MPLMSVILSSDTVRSLLFESALTYWPLALGSPIRPLLVKQLAFHFNLLSHLVKSAGLCRCEVEMGNGNDGLEGKSRQHAASQFGGEGKKSDCPGTAGWLRCRHVLLLSLI